MQQNRRDFLKGGAVLAAAGAVGIGSAAEGGAEAKPFAAGEPVLEAPAETSVGVAWAVNRLSTGTVEIADNPEMAGARTVKSGEMPLGCLDEESITVRVGGLKADTRYWYRTVTQEVV